MALRQHELVALGAITLALLANCGTATDPTLGATGASGRSASGGVDGGGAGSTGNTAGTAGMGGAGAGVSGAGGTEVGGTGGGTGGLGGTAGVGGVAGSSAGASGGTAGKAGGSGTAGTGGWAGGDACGVGTWAKFDNPGLGSLVVDQVSAGTPTHFFQSGGVVHAMPDKFGGAGYFLDPITGVVTAAPLSGAPGKDFAAGGVGVWTGGRLLLGGGQSGGINDGLITVTPGDQTWTLVSSSLALVNRPFATAVWTGTEMIIWGGGALFGSGPVQTGVRYHETKSTWTPTALSGAPQPRLRHTATWTGTRMLVWGGLSGPSAVAATGGTYDPITDSWQPISTVAAPSPRVNHTAVWTGSRWLVWGGRTSPDAPTGEGDGAAYDPTTDTWSPLTTVNAPAARHSHVAVWTGKVMFVHGGVTAGSPGSASTGALYDPTTDTWQSTACVIPEGHCVGGVAQRVGAQVVLSGGGASAIYTPP